MASATLGSPLGVIRVTAYLGGVGAGLLPQRSAFPRGGGEIHCLVLLFCCFKITVQTPARGAPRAAANGRACRLEDKCPVTRERSPGSEPGPGSLPTRPVLLSDRQSQTPAWFQCGEDGRPGPKGRRLMLRPPNGA